MHTLNKSQKDSNLMNQNFPHYQKEDTALALIAVLSFNENEPYRSSWRQKPLKPVLQTGSLGHSVRGQLPLTSYIIEPNKIFVSFSSLKASDWDDDNLKCLTKYFLLYN